MCFASQFAAGWGQPLAKLIDRRLGDQGHRHLAITNVEIARPRPVPAQRLMGVEELLHMPSLGKFAGQLLDLVAIAGREERVEAVLLRPLPLPLDVLVERPGLAVLRGVCQLRGRIARPPRPEQLRRQRPQFGDAGLARLGIGTRRSNFVPVLTRSRSSTVKCSESARTSVCPALGIEDLAGQFEQFLSRGRGRARRGAGGETDRVGRYRRRARRTSEPSWSAVPGHPGGGGACAAC